MLVAGREDTRQRLARPNDRPRGRSPLRYAGAAGLVLACGLALAYAAGAFLVVEHPLAPAQAIVVLAGGYPVREWEAARLYRAGYAPRIVLVQEWMDDPSRRADGAASRIEQRRALLIRSGVPAEAIVLAGRTACMTSDELLEARGLLDRPAEPVILLTSAYHARRVASLWQAGGPAPRAIVRTPTDDPFSPATWWYDRRYALRVVREYVGLATAALPLPQPSPPCGSTFTLAARLLDWLLS